MRKFFVHSLRWFIDLLGGVVLTHRLYNQIISQRDEVISKLVQTEEIKLNPGLVGVVFSRDRALQLYTLLHTYYAKVKEPAPLYVVYSASSSAHLESYNEIITALQAGGWNVTLIKELEGFRATLLKVLYQINSKNMFFLVDDDVFIRETDLTVAKQIDPLCTILSLRHSPHLRRSFTANAELRSPKFTPAKEGNGLLKFAWFEQNLEWADPWSVDGQVLSTAEVRVLASVSDFQAPNTFEGALKSFNSRCKSRYGLCYTESKIVNLPINRVQTEVSNRSGNISANYLLKCWNDGLMLDVRPLEKHIPLSTHEEHALGFVKRTPFMCQHIAASIPYQTNEGDSLAKKN